MALPSRFGERAMSVAEILPRPVLAACEPPPEKAPSLLRSFVTPPDNQFEALPRVAYEKPIWVSKNLLGHFFTISDPVGVKRVLLDNDANYPKTEMETRLLGGILGEG